MVVCGWEAGNMSSLKAVYYDAFNLLCGEKLGSGIHRDVFECKIRPDLVVKVEKGDYRYFANVLEMRFWCDNQYAKDIAKWLAPCEFLSPDGRLLLQKRAQPIISGSQLPKQIPAFLTDLKKENFGLLDGRVVCVDYALNNVTVSTRMRKPYWHLKTTEKRND